MTFEEQYPELAKFVRENEERDHMDKYYEGRAAVRFMKDISRSLSGFEGKTKRDYLVLVEEIENLVSEYEDGGE